MDFEIRLHQQGRAYRAVFGIGRRAYAALHHNAAGALYAAIKGWVGAEISAIRQRRKDKKAGR